MIVIKSRLGEGLVSSLGLKVNLSSYEFFDVLLSFPKVNVLPLRFSVSMGKFGSKTFGYDLDYVIRG